VAKFTGASSIGNSQIFDNGTNVGVGLITNIDSKLTVNGVISAVSSSYGPPNNGGAIQMFQDNANYATIWASANYNTAWGNVTLSRLGGRVLIGTAVDAGYTTDISGTLRSTQSAYFATTSGNVAIRSTLSNWSAATPALQILNASLYGFSTTENGLSQNAFYDGAWKYISNGFATSVQQTGGTIQLLNATSGLANGAITWAVRVQLKDSGNFLIGNTVDSGERLQVAGTARIYGTALPHLLIEQTAATGNVELQFSATDANYTAIIRSKAAQTIAFKDGTNSNLDIYPSGQISIGGGGAPFGSTNTLTVLAGTAPTATASDCFTLYSKDITAGNAAPHFITENGAIVKIYQETTSVAAAAFTANTGTAINDASTFDGYTLRQIVKALRNLGILN
jgi:hypothetical protein